VTALGGCNASGVARTILIDDGLGVADVVAVARDGARLELGSAARARVAAARAVVERLARGDAPVYGLNTALGARSGMRLAPDELEAFQARVPLGRAAGLGPELAPDVVRALLAARASGLAQGGAGVSPHVLDGLLALLARDVVPVVPAVGSIGAGDLPPLAAVALVLLGRGEATHDGRRLAGEAALAAAGLAPLRLGAKDGLALVSGNAVAAGHGALVVHDARVVLDAALAAAALSLEGFRGNPSAFDARVAAARPAPGQEDAAARLRALLAGSGLHAAGAPRRLQDPLSFRCLPAIGGAALDAVARLAACVEVELTAAADNPVVLAEHREMRSTGNFHTAAVALAAEGLGLALAQLASSALQRVARLLEPRHSGLPLGLTPSGGDRTGLGPLGLPLTALWAEIRRHAAPACLEPVSLADGIEDHAPHTPAVLQKTAQLVAAAARVVAIELAVAAQAVDLRGDVTLRPPLAAVHGAVRAEVAFVDDDRPLGTEVERLAGRVARGELLR
jgi:histidine ammonia-lyase